MNSTTQQEYAPSWVPAPDGRGTWQILYSNLITLFLCVFTAIHLHIPSNTMTIVGEWKRKFRWVVLTTVFPEVTLYTAGKHWFSARRLCVKMKIHLAVFRPDLGHDANTGSGWSVRRGYRTLKKYLTSRKSVKRGRRSSGFELEQQRSDSSTNNSPPQPSLISSIPYTQMIYAHYAVMGGFVIDVGHLSDTRTRVTLSHKAVAFLAKYGHFLAMEENVIRDKSKANLLAKTLVCAQVGWQLINTLARVIDGLPLTLLELHVLVHIVCAICMFVLWWEKPLDVYVPTLVDPSGFQDLLALMLVRNYGFGEPALDMRTGCPSPSSSIAKRVWVTNINREQSDRSEAAYLELFGTLLGEGNQPVPAGADDIGIMGDDVTEEPDFVIKTSSKKVSVGCTLQSGQSLSCGIGPAAEVHTPQGDSTAIAQSATRAASRGTLRILLSERDVRRWNLAATALERTHDGDSLKPASFFFETYVPNIFLVCKGMQAGHLYGYFLSWASGGLAAALSLCVVYGGVHLLAWNFDFPTAIERLLWRVACLDTVSGVCSLLTLFHATVYIHEHGFQSLLRAARSWEPGVLPCLFRIILAIGFLNIPFFMASRAFVVVETFVSLRRVPKAAYDTVKWSAYIPHF